MPADLRALLDAATPRPWKTERWYVRGPRFHRWHEKMHDGTRIEMSAPETVCEAGAMTTQGDADAALIVAAVNALPALLDAVDRLTRERDEALRVVAERSIKEGKARADVERLRGALTRARKNLDEAWAMQPEIPVRMVPTDFRPLSVREALRDIDAALAPAADAKGE